MTNEEYYKISKKLPDEPGVYYFLDKDGTILYIGRATSIRDRTSSYFSSDILRTRGRIILDMVARSTKLDWTRTDSVLEAVILEANLIKKYKPNANTADKDDKSFYYVVITNENFPKVLLVRGKDFAESFPKKDIKYAFGPYPNGFALKEGLKIVRRIFPYRDTCKTYEDEIAKHSKKKPKTCFNAQIGLCPGVCDGRIEKKTYSENIQNIRMFFEGRKKLLIKKLSQQMMRFAKNKDFEIANSIKRQIHDLSYIQDVSVIKDDTSVGDIGNHYKNISKEAIFPRIEAYDVAHISGSYTAGVMVVMEGKHLKKSDYRLFRIKRKGIDDTASLAEIIERRLTHSEWRWPDLVVVDGGKPQVNTVSRLFSENSKIEKQPIIVSVVKNEKHKPERFIGQAEVINKYKKEILILNSESHRFAIKYHRKLRKVI